MPGSPGQDMPGEKVNHLLPKRIRQERITAQPLSLSLLYKLFSVKGIVKTFLLFEFIHLDGVTLFIRTRAP